MELESAIQNVVRKLETSSVDAYEVVGLHEASLVIEAKHQMVETFHRSQSRGIAIRVVKDGCMSAASTTDIAPHAVEQSLSQLLGSLKYVAPSDDAHIPQVQMPVADFNEKTGKPFGEISEDDKIRMAMVLESAAIASDSRITCVQHPRYEERVWSMSVVNSKGISVESGRALSFCELKAVAFDGKNTEGAYEFEFFPRFEDLNAERLAGIASKRAIEKLGAKQISTGAKPVVFSQRATSTMLKLIAPSFFADNVQRGKSTIAKKMSERIYNQEVSIIDDGLLSGGLGSFPFDAEGIPKRRTMMVRNGVVENWLYDGARAAHDKKNSTGNCKRESFKRLPAIDVSNCFLKTSDKSFNDMIGQIKNGVLITELLGVHTANTITGDFSLGAEGMLIEDGCIGNPIRGVTVAGNAHDVFKNISGIGNDLRFFGSYGAPSVLVETLMLSA